jgi:hypothetical protein
MVANPMTDSTMHNSKPKMSIVPLDANNDNQEQFTDSLSAFCIYYEATQFICKGSSASRLVTRADPFPTTATIGVPTVKTEPKAPTEAEAEGKEEPDGMKSKAGGNERGTVPTPTYQGAGASAQNPLTERDFVNDDVECAVMGNSFTYYKTGTTTPESAEFKKARALLWLNLKTATDGA